MKEIRGKRVLIRNLERKDVDKMQQWSKHKDPLFFYYNFPKMTKKESDQWYQMKTKKWKKKSYAIENIEGKVIGYLSIRDIKWIKRESELGILLDPQYINKGYGTEAIKVFLKYYFETLKMYSMILRTAKFNKRAIRCYERCGFTVVKEQEEEFEDQYAEIFYNPMYENLKRLFIINNGRKLTKYLHMKVTKKEFYQYIHSLSTKIVPNCE